MSEKFMQHYVNGAGLRRLRANKNAEAVRLDTVRMQQEVLAALDAKQVSQLRLRQLQQYRHGEEQ